MNIEEERKAFEAWWSSENFTASAERKRCAFAGWKAAKAHAEEIAKPTVVIRESHYGWSIALVSDGIFNGIVKDEMASGEDAKVWARTNGCRVIE